MHVTCVAAFFPSGTMSLLQYFTRKVKVLLSESEGAEETGIGEKPTEEANTRVGEVFEQQQPGCTHKRKATIYLSKTRE